MARSTTAQEKAAAVALVAETLGVDPDALTALMQQPKPDAKAKAAPAQPTQTFAEVLESGVSTAGYAFHRGRAYVTKPLVEAQARALNARKPSFEIVKSEKADAFTAAIVVVRDENGRVYTQNLKRA